MPNEHERDIGAVEALVAMVAAIQARYDAAKAADRVELHLRLSDVHVLLALSKPAMDSLVRKMKG